MQTQKQHEEAKKKKKRGKLREGTSALAWGMTDWNSEETILIMKGFLLVAYSYLSFFNLNAVKV